jgi:leucyl-tRNA synthetase
VVRHPQPGRLHRRVHRPDARLVLHAARPIDGAVRSPGVHERHQHGIVLGNDGQKMSKSLRNYPDVSEVFERDGADAMRWFLMSSSVIRGGNLVVTEEGIREAVRQFLLPLWRRTTSSRCMPAT